MHSFFWLYLTINAPDFPLILLDRNTYVHYINLISLPHHFGIDVTWKQCLLCLHLHATFVHMEKVLFSYDVTTKVASEMRLRAYVPEYLCCLTILLKGDYILEEEPGQHFSYLIVSLK